MRRAIDICMLAGTLLLAGCSGRSSSQGSRQAASADAALTGLGATQEVWDAHHTADPFYGSQGGESMYNPDPSLPTASSGRLSDDYTSVSLGNDSRVEVYYLNFTDRPLAAALDRVKKDLPADTVFGTATPTSGSNNLQCLVLHATSQTLGKVLGGTPGSMVRIEFHSETATEVDESAINSAVVISELNGDAKACVGAQQQ